MTVRDAGFVRPEPLGSIVLGLAVRVTSVNGIFMENRKLGWGDCGALVPCLAWGSQADR